MNSNVGNLATHFKSWADDIKSLCRRCQMRMGPKGVPPHIAKQADTGGQLPSQPQQMVTQCRNNNHERVVTSMRIKSLTLLTVQI